MKHCRQIFPGNHRNPSSSAIARSGGSEEVTPAEPLGQTETASSDALSFRGADPGLPQTRTGIRTEWPSDRFPPPAHPPHN